MIRTNHPLYEALRDIQDFKLKLAEYFKDKDVFPIKSRVELAGALPCGVSLPTLKYSWNRSTYYYF